MNARLSAHDRLGVALFFAGLLHIVLILGVRFSNPPATGRARTLDVTLVQAISTKAPKHARRAAQVNVIGGGGQHRHHMAHSPFRVTAHGGGILTAQAKTQHSAVDHRHWRLLVDPRAPLQVEFADPHQQLKDTIAADLGMGHSFLVAEARLKAEIRRDWRAYRTAGSGAGGVTARRFAYAVYIENWTQRMEHISNNRYRQLLLDARAKGTLMLEVTIAANGTLQSVRVLSHDTPPALAALAIGLVRKAAPFSPLPKVTGEPLAVLPIIEKWQFQGSHMASMRPAVPSAS